MSYAGNKKSAISYHGLFHLTLDQSKLIDRLLVGSSALCTLSRFDASPLHVMLASGTKKIEYFYWFSLFYCSVSYYTTTALYCNFAGFVRSVQKKAKHKSNKRYSVHQYSIRDVCYYIVWQQGTKLIIITRIVTRKSSLEKITRKKNRWRQRSKHWDRGDRKGAGTVVQGRWRAGTVVSKRRRAGTVV